MTSTPELNKSFEITYSFAKDGDKKEGHPRGGQIYHEINFQVKSLNFLK